MKSFCVIGLESFGYTLATTLASRGHQVLVIDEDDSTVAKIADNVTNAVVGDPTNEAVLRAAGVSSYDCAIVCLDKIMQDSILVTLMLKEMGIKKIVARATNERHSKVLLKVGADQVVFPERDMGQKLAMMLGKTDVLEFINFSKSHAIVQIKVPKRWAGKSIIELNVRQKYGVNIIAIVKGDSEFEIFSNPSRALNAEEELVIIGSNDDIEKLTRN